MDICTIVSNNYLAAATVLAESHRQHDPNAQVYALIVDRPADKIAYDALPFHVVFVEELDIPAFDNMAFRYDVVELNTAVKPFFLSYLRDHVGLDRVLYLDPDILVLDRLSGLESALETSNLLLTPHITQPLDNDFQPGERTFLQTGAYNLGFLGLRLTDETSEFLDWWQDRLYRFCQIDLASGLFVDQKWMDLAPSILDRVEVVRDPIYNIAYWNLAHRVVAETDAGYRVDGRPIAFFHFSGFDVDAPETVSRHQNRIHFRDRPRLESLFERYAEQLAEAGHQRLRTLSYGYGHFRRTGIPIPRMTRQLLQRVDPLGRRWANPFDEAGRESFLSWLVEPLEFELGFLNRTALTLWESRPDLVRAFPDPTGADLPRYVDWLIPCEEAARAGVDGRLMRGVGVRTQETTPAPVPHEPVPHPYDLTIQESAEQFLSEIDLRRPGKLASWLNEPVIGSRDREAWLPRIALLLYQVREDVQRIYPDPLGDDRVPFVLWFVTHGALEMELHPSLTRPVWRSLPLAFRIARLPTRARFLWRSRHDSADLAPELPEPAPEGDPAPAVPKARATESGVNLAGYFDHPSGVGQIGRGVLQALERAAVPVASLSIDQLEANRAVHGRVQPPEGAPYPLTLVCANADQLPTVLSKLPMTARVRCHRIGYWFWELSHFPVELADRFDYIDELWAPSRFCYEAFRPLSSIPVRWVPPYAPAPRAATGSRDRFGLDSDRFYFLYAFDTLSVPERKNPFAAIEAIRRLERTTDREVGLILKVNRAQRAPGLMAELRKRAAGASVNLVLKDLSRTEMDALISAADAIVSPHRSEGLGLLAIEGLYLQKPVVATEYGGVTDFFDEGTGFPVTYALRRLDRAYGPYPAGSVWAEPRVDDAVEQMRRVLDDPEEAARRTAAGRARVEALYGLDAAAQRFAAELRRAAPATSARDEDARSDSKSAAPAG